MMVLVERTHCPYCGHEIVVYFNEENRLFGTTITCKSNFCGKAFVVNTAQIFEESTDLSGSATVREVKRMKEEVERDEDQTLLSEYV